ncbi:MAG: hypothetical protein ACRBCI_04490 [Cellvibrionaceae bacterium]
MDEIILEILEAWRNKGNFGLSVPFLFGALCQHPDQTMVGNDAREKFESFINIIGQSNSILRLSYCDKANDLILAPVHDVPAGCKNIESTRLWVQHDVVPEDAATKKSLHIALWEKYGLHLVDNNFSCTNGHYYPFSNEDKLFISEAFGQNA